MTYYATQEMAASGSLHNRITACAAQEGFTNPVEWTAQHVWAVVARTDWSDAWTYAKDNYNINQNPDIGARNDVISDAMILAAVQAVGP